MDNALLELQSCCEIILTTSPDVSQVPIVPLLELFAILKKIVSALGMLFSFASDDITVKCDRIRELCNKAGLLQTTVNAVIVREKEKKTIETGAIRNLLPLIRSMEFVALMLNTLITSEKELGECLRESYYQTLYHRHSYPIVAAVVAASWTVPTKDNFFLVLGVTRPRGLDLCRELSPRLTKIFEGLRHLYIEEDVWEMK